MGWKSIGWKNTKWTLHFSLETLPPHPQGPLLEPKNANYVQHVSFFFTNCTFLLLLSIQHSTGYIVEVLLHILLLANIPLWVNFQEYICTLVVKGRPSILAISFPIIWCTLFYFIPSLFIYIILLLILFNSIKLNFLFQFSLIMDYLCVLSFIILFFTSIS